MIIKPNTKEKKCDKYTGGGLIKKIYTSGGDARELEVVSSADQRDLQVEVWLMGLVRRLG